MLTKPLKKLLSETKGLNFDFKEHCFFCLEVTECTLNSEYDTKIPSQCRVSSSNVETTKTGDGQNYIDFLINKCKEGNDKLGRVVHDRLLAANGDLVAVKARYHHKCSCLFHKLASVEASSGSVMDEALLHTIQELDQDLPKFGTQ